MWNYIALYFKFRYLETIMSLAIQDQPMDYTDAPGLSLTIARNELLKALSHVQSVVEKRGTIPILSNIRIDAQDGHIELTATDMELAVVDRAPVQLSASGSTTAPAHMLYDIIRKLPEDAEVSLKEDKSAGKLHVNAGSSRFSLSTLPTEDFPAITEGELPNHFSLTREECRALIEKTRFAMSNEETRYYLNGVYLHAAQQDDNEVLRGVATDGHRLSRVDVALPAGASGMPGVIIPRKAINELVKLFDDNNKEVKVSLSDTKIRFVCGHVVLVSKLIDGTFPDYTRVIPEHNDNTLEIGAVALAKAVDRVSVVASEKIRGVKLSLESNHVTLTTSSSDYNSGEEQVEASFDGSPVEIGFNARYLLDVLGHIESPTARFSVSDTNSPSIITDAEYSGALYVVMPMRV